MVASSVLSINMGKLTHYDQLKFSHPKVIKNDYHVRLGLVLFYETSCGTLNFSVLWCIDVWWNKIAHKPFDLWLTDSTYIRMISSAQLFDMLHPNVVCFSAELCFEKGEIQKIFGVQSYSLSQIWYRIWGIECGLVLLAVNGWNMFLWYLYRCLNLPCLWKLMFIKMVLKHSSYLFAFVGVSLKRLAEAYRNMYVYKKQEMRW